MQWLVNLCRHSFTRTIRSRRRSRPAGNRPAGPTAIVTPSDFLIHVFSKFDLPARSIPNIIDLERFHFRERICPKPLFLHNRGDGTFEDRSAAAGLSSQVLSLNGCHADFDNDGLLDVLLLRGAWEVPRRMSLLRNRNGVFEDVTLAAGLGEPISSQAAGWADYDNDGHIDLFVAGEFDATRPDPRNRCRLYHNRGNGTFEEVALES